MAQAVGEELLSRCRESGDAPAIVQAHYGHGATLYDLGEFGAARTHLERALALYDPATHRAHVATYGGYDPGVACRFWLAWIAWWTGAPDRALARRGGYLACRHEHPLTLSYALVSSALVHPTGRARARRRTAGGGGSAIARDEGFAFSARSPTRSGGRCC